METVAPHTLSACNPLHLSIVRVPCTGHGRWKHVLIKKLHGGQPNPVVTHFLDFTVVVSRFAAVPVACTRCDANMDANGTVLFRALTSESRPPPPATRGTRALPERSLRYGCTLAAGYGSEVSAMGVSEVVGGEAGRPSAFA